VNKIERVRAALTGGPVDHPPLTLWYHFGLQHAPAERVIQAHLEFFEAYDLDLLKVMNDYSYPMPEDVETLDRAEDLSRLGPLDVTRGPIGEQLRVIRGLAQALRGRALVVETLFNAWNTLRRNVVKGAMGAFMRSAPHALETALAVANDNLARYAQAALEAGAAGIFLSVPASSEFLTREQYERFMRPFDLALLEAVRDRGESHILHAHGAALYLDRLLDYPAHALSWADRDSGPSLGEVRAMTSRCLMGGLSHGNFAYASATEIREQVESAAAAAGRERLILAPGCAVPTYTFPELIRVTRDASRRV
jgi:uroporphyrinogen decarboxylase